MLKLFFKCIIRVEATCWKERNVRKQNEIIEIGAVKINRRGDILDEFNEFVKPKLNPKLSPFCKELTTITQNEIDNADYFPAVIERFKNWINLDDFFYLCSWGFYDKNQFVKDSELHQLDTNWLKNHISLKHQYTEIKKLKKHIGMANALKIENIPLKGTHHRGIDDAKNIAQIFIANITKWTF
ncbi:MAG: exonuclease domain-containing protein [Bacteroidales bacterium]|nr:exonuclease domain-containing protein [Bacteroidales bacterium]